MPRAVDVGTQIPQAALRAYVMGDRALDAPTADDLTAMTRAVADGLRAGALGMSFGRTAGHRSASGQPVPGTYSDEDELVALMTAMAEAGGGVLQVVPAGVGGEIGGDDRHSIDAEVEWISRLGERFRIPTTFLAMVNEQDPHDWQRWFRDARTANAAGANVRPQVASRAFGMLMGHQSRMNPSRHRASYRTLMDLPLAQRVRALRDPHKGANPGGEARPQRDTVGRPAHDRRPRRS